MKPKSLVLVAFLMVLYIVPLISMSTYASSTILAQPNTSKEFTISADWYNEDWQYRKSVDITGIYGDIDPLYNYQVRIPVTYDSDMLIDFDDIRFIEEDHTTELDYWRESYIASTSAVFWVEVLEDVNADVTIYMYYGNSAVSTTSNGTATFLFYEDWSSQTIDAWTMPAAQADGQTTFSVTDATQGGYVAKVEGNAADSYLIHSDFNYTAPFATMFRANIEEASTGNTGRFGSGWAGAYGWALVQTLSTGESFNVVDDDSNSDAQAMTNAYFDSWIVFQITRDATNAKLYADTVLIETASFAPDAVDNPVCNIQNIDSEDDIYSDWVAVRKFTTTEPEFDSFGSEETNIPPPEWEIVGEAELVIFVPLDETALNWFLIILGMFMVPASALYLVKGGKKDASMDKVFYFIVAFLFGWGLIFIGVS